MTFKTMWMRWLDFRRLLGMFSIVAAHDCALRARDLNELAVKAGILVNDKGEPFKPTTLYHYRRTLERLGLVYVQERRYCVQHGNPVVAELLSELRDDELLSVRQRTSLATLVVRNSDCYESFLRAFLMTDECPDTVEDFIRVATPVSVHIEGGERAAPAIRLRNLDAGFEMSLHGENAAQAILWGLKSWCVDQLRFIDEIFSLGVGYVLYPRAISAPWPVDVIAQKLIHLLEFTDEWATTRVEELILVAGRRWRLPAQSVREALLLLSRRFPEFVATVPTSEQFILSGLHPAQRRAALNSYIQLPSGEHVSHFRVHSRIALVTGKEGDKI